MTIPHVGHTEDQAQRRAAGTFLLAALWIVGVLLVSHVLLHLLPGNSAPLVQALANLVLLFGGFYWIGLRRVQDARPLSAIGLVRRPTQWREVAIGITLGWAIALLLVLPALLTRNLHTLLEPDLIHLRDGFLSLLLTALNAVATQLLFTGLAFRALTRATSPGTAAFVSAIVAGALLSASPGHDAGQTFFAALASFLFSLAALRTRAIWLPIGLQFGWSAALTLLFGTGSFYWPTVSGPITSYVTGARSLTGSNIGPEASLWALPVVLIGLLVLWRTTRDLAWHYAHDSIIAAGYPMDVAPPAEHTRMEEQASLQAVPLVQIQGASPVVLTPTQDR